MIPTVEICKADALEFLDDTAGSRFTPPIQTWAFGMAYLTLADLFVLYQISKIKKVVTYSLPALTSVLTPATAGVDDFGELIQLEERLDGSSEQYNSIAETEKLRQSSSSETLAEFEWRDDTFFFSPATSARQIQLTYYASGAAPATGPVGIDGSRLLLAKLTAAYMAPRKGDPEQGKDLMTQAVGPKFSDGIVGGDARRMIQPMVRSQQRIPVAPRPFRVGAMPLARLGGRFYVAPATYNTFIPEMTFTITGAINGTDGTDGNAVFVLDQSPSSLNLFSNGTLMYPGTSYTLVGDTITFLTGYIPVAGDLLYAKGAVGDVSYITANLAAPESVVISGAIDGTDGSDGNATFTLASSPTSLQIFKSGLLMDLNTAYTRTGVTITFLPPYVPVVGNTLAAWGTL